MLKCLRKINLSDDSLRKNDDFFQNYDFLRKAKSNLTKNQIYILRKSAALRIPHYMRSLNINNIVEHKYKVFTFLPWG